VKEKCANSATFSCGIRTRRDQSYGYEIIQIVRQLSGGSRPRKYYTIKPAGRAALESEKARWLDLHETLLKAWNLEVRLTGTTNTPTGFTGARRTSRAIS